ncbi:MAG: divergent polysaccharide deacetylase family protein [Kiloniellaceae bacterium]
MSSFFANRGALITAWFVVAALVAGLLVLVLLQPPPPGTGEAVVIALDLPEPGAAEVAPSPATEAAEGETPAAAETPPGATGDVPAEAVQVEIPPAPEPEPATEGSTAAPEPLAEPESKNEAAPAEVEAPAAATPSPTPDPTAADPTETGPAKTEEREEPAEVPLEQLALIPVIPPAPEQLLYWERYRQPFNMDDKRPRIAVVLTGLGLSDSATEAAINQLPPAVTLSFSPYARGLERWIALARARGHEVMLDLPMEPASFPNEDPGPQALLTSLTAEANLDRLDWVLSRGSAYVGLAGSMGSRFTASRDALEPILRAVKDRGLIFLDRRTTEDSLVPVVAGEIGLPSAINNRSVDERQASRVAIDARLAQIERIALTDGFAVAMAQPYPVTLERLAEWTTELTSRGFAIAPISALADRQKAP